MTALRQVLQAAYSPAVFNVETMEQAKRIILTPQAGMSPEQRWRTETPYLLGLIDKSFVLNQHSVVLDYGCGIGRMAKALIEKYNCHVVGVDISPSMRALASAYVSSNNFIVCAPEALTWLKLKFDLALAIWVLQHCDDVKSDIERIHSVLQKNQFVGGVNIGGSLFVLNDHRRIVPTDKAGWVDDGQDVPALLKSAGFVDPDIRSLDPAILGEQPAQCSYWATFKVA